MAAITVRQKKSLIGSTDRQRATVRSLGLRRLGQSLEKQDTPELRAMVKSVEHLVEIVATAKAGGKK